MILSNRMSVARLLAGFFGRLITAALSEHIESEVLHAYKEV